uniref:Uncharacterized protein n=1 Tax=Tanacetum cinerariifolium TaxID=118510 RepID=A0A6L2LR19_TANCI|nr:hypothetical protein [Tanacetum cinerariifolium]
MGAVDRRDGSAINVLTSKFASMSTFLKKIRSTIVCCGNHPNREGNECGNHRPCTNFEGFYDNHGRNPSLKQVWRRDDILSSNAEEGEETLDEYNRGPGRGDRPRTMDLDGKGARIADYFDIIAGTSTGDS